MKSLLESYKIECKKILSPYGFKNCGVNHLRLINDVVQYIGLQILSGKRYCRIYFGIRPLCCIKSEVHPKFANGDYDLRMFEGYKKAWEYDKKSQESINNCVENIIWYIKTYLLEVFKRGIDCKSGYHEIYNFEQTSYDLAKKLYLEQGKKWEDARYIKNGIYMNDYRKFCMALKIGDYDLSLEYLTTIYNHMLTNGTSEKNILLYKQKIDHITNRNMDFINNFINTNEKEALIVLAKFV